MFGLFDRLKLAQDLPFHADESTQAWILHQSVESYLKYDPHHHHGLLPLMVRKYFLGKLFNQGWDQWSEIDLRMSSLIYTNYGKDI